MTGPADTPAPQLPPDARTWALICHLSPLAWLIGIPFGHILGPLVAWLARRDVHPFVDEAGKESLNFQISLTIYVFVAAIVIVPAALIGVIIPGPWTFLGLPFVILAAIAVAIVAVALPVVAGLAANRGEQYRYPFTLRLVR